MVCLLLSRSGPLGPLGLPFTPTAMVVAQSILVVPLVAALARRLMRTAWADGSDQVRLLGASTALAGLLLLAHEGLGDRLAAVARRHVTGERRLSPRALPFGGPDDMSTRRGSNPHAEASALNLDPAVDR